MTRQIVDPLSRVILAAIIMTVGCQVSGATIGAKSASLGDVESAIGSAHEGDTVIVPAGNLREARLRFERDYIAAVLQHHAWRMADAAQTLGIQRPNLYRKARQLGIPLARLSE